GLDVLGQERGRSWRGLVAAEHGRVDEEVRNEGVACGSRHGQPDSSRRPTPRILLRPHVNSARSGEIATDWLAVYRRRGLQLSPYAVSPRYLRCCGGKEEAVAAAGDRGDETWLSPVVGQSRAQIADLAIDHVALGHVVCPTQGVENL